MRNARERGEIKLSTVITLIIAAFAVYQVIQWGGPVFNVYSFADTVKEECRFGLGKDPKVITRSLVTKAQELGLSVEPSNITITQVATRTRILVNYQVEVEWFPGQIYTWDINIDESSQFY